MDDERTEFQTPDGLAQLLNLLDRDPFITPTATRLIISAYEQSKDYALKHGNWKDANNQASFTPTIYVVLQSPFVDGSGIADVLGVFSTSEKAYALVGSLMLRDARNGDLSVIERHLDEIV